MMEKTNLVQVESSQGITRVLLNRPEVRNAFNPQLVVELCEVFQKFREDESVRGIVLAGSGPVFCAGMDLHEVASARQGSDIQRIQVAEHLLAMYEALDDCPCPIIGRVQGGAYGGGVGLVACCDLVIASEEAQFALREVRVGLVPAVIAPYVMRKFGFSQTSRYALTGKTFSAQEARRIGLVHEVVPEGELDSHCQALIEELLQSGPIAVRETKKLLRRLLELPEQEQGILCAQTNARVGGTREAEEGLRAFLDKRPPAWTQPVSGAKASR